MSGRSFDSSSKFLNSGVVHATDESCVSSGKAYLIYVLFRVRWVSLAHTGVQCFGPVLSDYSQVNTIGSLGALSHSTTITFDFSSVSGCSSKYSCLGLEFSDSIFVLCGPEQLTGKT